MQKQVFHYIQQEEEEEEEEEGDIICQRSR
jgi:hypothetical protein